MITIVDYGMGNLGSIKNMLKRINVSSQVTSDYELIKDATKLLLPGVGSFGVAMKKLNQSSLRFLLEKKVFDDQVPILGICLGMQILTDHSEEGGVPGLGWISAKTRRFPDHPSFKVPHMGWNIATPTQENALISDFAKNTRFYFVHSYYVKVDNQEESILKTKYGLTFDSAIAKGNIYGAQFHPEKSHKFGMKVLGNFASI